MAKTSIIKETRDILQKAGKEAKEHWQEPPEAQIPVGDSGWYTSPNLQSDKGVDPRNCAEWPDSPFCGGNPWTRTPVGFDFDYGVDKCGAWVEATPILGFTKLPPVSVGYRQPGECREEKKPPPVTPPPEAEDQGRAVERLDFPSLIDPESTVFVVIVRSYSYFYFFNATDNSLNIYSDQSWVESHSYPDPIFNREAYYPQYNQPGKPKAEATVKTTWKYLDVPGRGVNSPRIQEGGVAYNTGWIAYDQPPLRADTRFWGLRQLDDSYYLTPILEFNRPPSASGAARLFLPYPDYYAPGNFCILGQYGEIVSKWQGYGFDQIQNVDGALIIRKAEYKIGYISVPDKRKQPPPPDAERKRKCCMQCCNGGSQQQNKQDQDNAEILRLLREINKKLGTFPYKAQIFDANDNKKGAQAKTMSVASVSDGQKLIVAEQEKTLKSVGIDEFPIYVPSSIVNDESNGFLGDLGDLKNKIFKQRIESIAELLNWKIKNDHEVHGQWQDYIEIQDSDPTQKGNQPKKIVLPNMARSFRELVLLNSIQIKTTGIILDTVLKLYIDIANTKVTTATTEAIVRDIQDFLDYPTVEKNLDVPLGIKIPADNDSPDDKEDLNRFLSPSHVKAKFDDWTGEGSIHDMLVVLLDAASMIKATFYNKA